jgi:hypothetical protein
LTPLIQYSRVVIDTAESKLAVSATIKGKKVHKE